MIVKMIILRFLGSSDDKEKENIGVARTGGPPLRGFRPESSSDQEHRKNRHYNVWCRRESKPSQSIGTG